MISYILCLPDGNAELIPSIILIVSLAKSLSSVGVLFCSLIKLNFHFYTQCTGYPLGLEQCKILAATKDPREV